MDRQEARPSPRRPETVSEPRERVFLLAGDVPLPDGVAEDDEGVFVIRLVAPTPEDVEAAKNVAY